ncbi:TatD family hydrolase [Trueperella pecoris]|uniref:TatD family hydrolase n=1 Tax=Trueperella pecoris TaxID=2733571 RepID=A0A7M1QU24_9ACTO|nr:TatD family hydrolase [Trueperella pecoris]QOQ38171.1 TatD family hydrolase [Trueperella pecoris]QOR45343.1 TatD family hydrolase [Trueperella pecoris]QTG75220.1 TatD family hydrolase [Trueperella pecoris]
MGDSTSKKDRRRAYPAIPAPLTVPIVDNHTHISPDPAPDAGSDRPVQRLNLAGDWKPPILLENLREAMARSGVRAAITSGCEYPDLQWTADLARDYPELWAALAIHPNEAAMHAGVREVAPDGLEPRAEAHHSIPLDDAIAEVARLGREDGVVAIGETGLDYFRTGELGKEAQKRSFREHIALAKELGKPLQIHDRDAHADVVEILKRDGAPQRTVFHCFSGDADLATVCRQNGWYASFAGPVTYPANDDLRDAFDALPNDLILLETDAPYLTPAPYRGQPNATWAVVYTAGYLARHRGLSLEEFCAVVDRTTREVYGI